MIWARTVAGPPLDRHKEVASSFSMRLRMGLIFFLVLAGDRVFGQQQTVGDYSSSTDSATLRSGVAHVTAVLEQRNRSSVMVTRNVEASGPLVRLFKGRIREAPKRFLQLINPFASGDEQARIAAPKGLSPRAWTTVVGVHPGASAFPEPMTHEGGITLISASRP
jgi:hypothetical protein